MRHRVWPWLILAAVCAIGCASLASAQRCSSYDGNYRLDSFEHFVLQLIDPSGATVRLTEADAYAAKSTRSGFYTGTLWKIKVPGTNPPRDVWVKAYKHRRRDEFFMSYCHPDRIAAGWSVDSLEQQFHVGFKTPPDLNKQKAAVPIVYGPTFYSLSEVEARPEGVAAIYPTFLQTQQVSLLSYDGNLSTGDCMSMATDDDRGNRKLLGVKVVGFPSVVKFIARYYPEKGITDPNPVSWVAPYKIQLGFFSGGLEEAIDWYRRGQLWRPGSFLRRRLPTRRTMHPLIRACKFVVGVGTSYGPDILPHGQPDMSPQYRQDMLNYFSLVHGDNMLLYHLGWYQESPYNPPSGVPGHDPILALIQGIIPPTTYLPQVFPDMFKTITPGHAALIAEARARNTRSVGYTLPAVQSPFVLDYDADTARVDETGEADDTADSGRPEGTHSFLCWYQNKTVDLFTDLYVNNVVGRHGFAGTYLDALSPQPFCYGFQEHRHPTDCNEQLIGIDQMLGKIRSHFLRRRQMPPLLINETPSDCLRTDGSALDYNATDPNFYNLFAMTYSGAEFPRFGVVYGYNPFTYGPDGYEYLVQLASALASGARPLILWPEYRLPPQILPELPPVYATYGFPTNPLAVTDPWFPVFLNLLNSYSANWDGFWRDIMHGRRLEPLDPMEITVDSIINPPPPPPYPADPVTCRWRLPGWQPRLNGPGCHLKRLTDKPHPAVFHGLFEPQGQPGRRCLVMVRWSDPSLAQKLNLPATHPACKRLEKVRLRLSARNTCARPGAGIRLWNLKTKLWRNLGRLPFNPAEKTGPIEIELDGMGAKVVVID